MGWDVGGVLWIGAARPARTFAEDADALGVLDVPDSDGEVIRARREEGEVRVEGARAHIGQVAREEAARLQ
eukprot:4175520-Prymnesium_polylepis.1